VPKIDDEHNPLAVRPVPGGMVEVVIEDQALASFPVQQLIAAAQVAVTIGNVDTLPRQIDDKTFGGRQRAALFQQI
jgi:hypothetical protein